jgi:hypothetical protein
MLKNVKNVLLVAALAVSGLVSAQEVYQYKGFGMTISYEFTEEELKVTNHKGDSETVGITLIEKSDLITIYTSNSIRGKRTKYTLVKKGKKGKYMMLMDIVDDFTKGVTTANLIVSKVAS